VIFALNLNFNFNTKSTLKYKFEIEDKLKHEIIYVHKLLDSDALISPEPSIFVRVDLGIIFFSSVR
jgi:hypothetical protein